MGLISVGKTLTTVLLWLVIVFEVLLLGCKCESSYRSVNDISGGKVHQSPDYDDGAQLIRELFRDFDKYKAVVDTSLKMLCHLSRLGRDPLPECTQCTAAIRLLIDSLIKQHHWAIHMGDAMLKPSTGLLDGSLQMLSNFDECMGIPVFNLSSDPGLSRKFPELTAENLTQIRGTYCAIKIDAKFGDIGENASGIFSLFTKQELRLLKDVNKFIDELPGFLGLCLPSPCTRLGLVEIQRALTFMVAAGLKSGMIPPLPLKIIPTIVSCKTNEHLHHVHWTLSAKLIIGIITALVGIVISATLVELTWHHFDRRSTILQSTDKPLYTDDYQNPNCCYRICRSFSIFSSLKRLNNKTISRSNYISCISGLRMLTLFWLFIGNLAFVRNWSFMGNVRWLLPYIETIIKEFAFNYTLAYDSLFTIFGFITAYSVSQQLSSIAIYKSRSLEYTMRLLSKYLLHRINRVYPMYMLLLWLWTTTFSGWGAGPSWDLERTQLLKKCSQHWWWNAMLINNMTPAKEQCLPYTWIYAYMLQSIAVSIVFLAIWKRAPAAGSVSLVFLVIGTALLTFIKNLTLDLGPTQLIREYRPGSRNDYMNNIAMQVFTRGGPFLTGVLSGMYLTSRKARMSKIVAFFGWICSLVVLLGVSNATFEWNLGWSQPSPLFNALYDSTHRILWAAAISFLIIACHCGKGGLLNKCLSWSGWIPMNRLLYAMYLINPMLLIYNNGTAKAPEYLTFKYMTMELMYVMSLTVLLSMIAHVFLEAPFLALEECFQRSDEAKETGRSRSASQLSATDKMDEQRFQHSTGTQSDQNGLALKEMSV